MLPSRFSKLSVKIMLSCLAGLAVLCSITLGLAERPWLASERLASEPGGLAATELAASGPVSPASTSSRASLLSRRTSSQQEGWLRRGDRGPQVEQLQEQLQALGYDLTGAREQFDATTEQAIFQFQTSAGLGIDGIVGPETERALAQAIDPQTLSSSQPANPADQDNRASWRNSDSVMMPPDIQRIIQRGKLVVAVLAQDNPPFFLTDTEGELLGSDVKMAQQLADQLGVDLVFNREAKTFNEVVDQVYEHHADLAISKISRTLKRAQRVSFSEPYLSMRQGLLVNRVQFAEKAKGENMAEMLRTLEGRVGVIQGSSYGGFVQQKFPKATAVEYATWQAVVKAVTQGEVMAAYRDELEVKKIVLNNPDASLQFQTIALTDTQDPLAMVLPWDSQHLNRFVNQYLETLQQEYSVDGLLEDYLDYL